MHLTVAILLSLLAIVYASPKHHIVPRQIGQHLQSNGFRPTISTVYSTRSRYEDENVDDEEGVEELNGDSSVSSTQIRRPLFENTYFQNSIPVSQARPPQQQLVKRPPPGPPQQYRPQQFPDVCFIFIINHTRIS